MAFSGIATVELISDNLVRITGVYLEAGAQGFIAPGAGSGLVVPFISLPDGFHVDPYTTQQGEDPITFESGVQVWWVPTSAGEGTFMPVVTIEKTPLGVVTFQNISAEDGPEMEIYLRWH